LADEFVKVIITVIVTEQFPPFACYQFFQTNSLIVITRFLKNPSSRWMDDKLSDTVSTPAAIQLLMTV
jgi:hypothetical protein